MNAEDRTHWLAPSPSMAGDGVAQRRFRSGAVEDASPDAGTLGAILEALTDAARERREPTREEADRLSGSH